MHHSSSLARPLFLTSLLTLLTAVACGGSSSPTTSAGAGGTPTAGTGGTPGVGGSGAEVPTPGNGSAPVVAGSLAAAYQAHFPIGVAIETSHLSTVGDIIDREFNRLTAENSMKWSSMQPTEGNFTTTQADVLADAARERSWKMTGHTLVWHRQTPSWVGEGTLADVQARLQAHIEFMVDRYGDVVDNWDVVNEAISDDGSSFRQGGEVTDFDWYGAFGSEEYVYWAFKYADDALEAQAAGSSEGKLYYNDYNAHQKIDAIIAMLDAVNARSEAEGGERLVDGIGFQAHVRIDWPGTSDLSEAFDKVVAAGYSLKVSELDVTVYNDYPPPDYSLVPAPEVEFTAALEQEQAARYADLFSLFREYSEHISSVTFWGVSDDDTWLDGEPVPGRDNYPLLFNDDHEPKAAYDAIKNF